MGSIKSESISKIRYPDSRFQIPNILNELLLRHYYLQINLLIIAWWVFDKRYLSFYHQLSSINFDEKFSHTWNFLSDAFKLFSFRLEATLIMMLPSSTMRARRTTFCMFNESEMERSSFPLLWRPSLGIYTFKRRVLFWKHQVSTGPHTLWWGGGWDPTHNLVWEENQSMLLLQQVGLGKKKIMPRWNEITAREDVVDDDEFLQLTKRENFVRVARLMKKRDLNSKIRFICII